MKKSNRFRIVREPVDDIFGSESYGRGFPPGIRRSRADAGYSDPRLRGLDPSSVGGQSGGQLSVTAARSAIMNPDPYEEQARQQREIGRRMPLPYQAASSLAGLPSPTGEPPEASKIYADIGSPSSIYSSQSIAGQHETQARSFGAPPDTLENYWDERHRFGYGQMQSRGAGYSEDWDTRGGRERTAGRLSTTGSFDQHVRPDIPYLQLKAGGSATEPEGTFDGNALVSVSVGNFQDGQATQTRTFLLGGGFVGAFDLRRWDNVTITVLELMADTYVEFAWTAEGLPGEDRSLYYAQQYVADGTQQPVPEGAHSVYVMNPAPSVVATTVTLTWLSYLNGSPFSFPMEVSDNSTVAQPAVRPYSYFANPIRVLGTTFQIDESTNLVWALRPI